MSLDSIYYSSDANSTTMHRNLVSCLLFWEQKENLLRADIADMGQTGHIAVDYVCGRNESLFSPLRREGSAEDTFAKHLHSHTVRFELVATKSMKNPAIVDQGLEMAEKCFNLINADVQIIVSTKTGHGEDNSLLLRFWQISDRSKISYLEKCKCFHGIAYLTTCVKYPGTAKADQTDVFRLYASSVSQIYFVKIIAVAENHQTTAQINLFGSCIKKYSPDFGFKRSPWFVKTGYDLCKTPYHRVYLRDVQVMPLDPAGQIAVFTTITFILLSSFGVLVYVAKKGTQ